MSEHDEQAALFQMLSFHPDLWVIFAVPNGGLRSKRNAVTLKREGVKAGVWDIFVPIPKGIYHGMWLEMKYGKNKLSEAQVLFGDQMRQNGYVTEVAYSAEEAYAKIQSYLGVVNG